jgi:hypothetical protein
MKSIFIFFNYSLHLHKGIYTKQNTSFLFIYPTHMLVVKQEPMIFDVLLQILIATIAFSL